MTFVPVRVKWSQEQEPITSCEGRWSCLTSSSLSKLYMSAPLGFSFSWKPRTETLPLLSPARAAVRLASNEGLELRENSRITRKRNSFNLVIVGKVIVWDFWGFAARRKTQIPYSQSSPSMALAKTIAALGTRMLTLAFHLLSVSLSPPWWNC